MALQNGILLRICRGPTCGKKSGEIEAAAKQHIADHNLQESVEIAWQSCFGRCSLGPTVLIEHWRDGRPNDNAMLAIMLGTAHPDMRFEQAVKVADIPALIDSQLLNWQHTMGRHKSAHGTK